MALELREVLRDHPAPSSGCPLPINKADFGVDNKAALVDSGLDNKAVKKKRIRVRVCDEYIKALLAHPPSEKPARVPTKETFSHFSAETQERLVSRSVKLAGMLNARRDRDLDTLAQYHKNRVAYKVLELDEEGLIKFINNGGVYEEIDDA